MILLGAAKRIVIITRDFTTHRRANIYSNFVSPLIYRLSNDFKFTVFSFGRNSHQMVKEIKVHTLSKKFSQANLWGDLIGKSLSLLDLFKNVIRMWNSLQPDIISWFWPITPITSLVRNSISCPHVSILFTYSKRYSMYDPMMRLSLMNQQKIVTTSEAMRQKIIRLGFESEKVRRIPLGVDLDQFKPDQDKPNFKRMYGFHGNCKLVLWSGPIHPYSPNDLQIILDVIKLIRKSMSDVCFILSFKGEIPEGLPRFEGVSYVHRTYDMWDLMKAVDVAFLPMFYSSELFHFPLTMIEALASGVPVITTPRPGFNEMIVEGFNGFLARSFKDLHIKLASIIRYEERLLTMQKNARYYAEKHFDLNKICKSYMLLWSGEV